MEIKAKVAQKPQTIKTKEFTQKPDLKVKVAQNAPTTIFDIEYILFLDDGWF